MRESPRRRQIDVEKKPHLRSGGFSACYTVLRDIRMDPEVSFPEGWNAPAELTGALPRETRISEDGIWAAARAAFFLLAAFAIVLLGCKMEARKMANRAALRRDGREAIGEVTELRHRLEGMYTVSYAFDVNGVVFTGMASAPADVGGGLRKALPLTVRFLPSNPGINQPAAWEAPVLSDWFTFAIALMPAVAGIFVLTQLRRQRQLVAEGVPTAGVVTKRSRNSKGLWCVFYQFRTEDGRVAKGSDTACLEIGVTTCVLYLPQEPSRNQRYLGSWYRVAR